MFKVAIAFIGIIFIIVSLILIGFAYDKQEEQAMISVCESHGGVTLKHTWRVGKNKNTNWVCVDPKIIINTD
jgi:hypothetical protein